MVEDGKITGFVNDIVISEVTYGFIRATTQFKRYELQKSISRIKIDLSHLKRLFSIFENLPLNFGISVLKFIEKYHLLPNDALIAATCKYYGINKIATFDEDFEKVDFFGSGEGLKIIF